MATRVNVAMIVFLALAGCGEGGEELLLGDEEWASFMKDGKADTGGISEGSAEATAVLKLANEHPLIDFVAPSRAGLGSVTNGLIAGKNILYYRLGDDGRSGTADDARFDTLAELDALPFVGPIAFGKLLAYARTLGYVGTTPPAAPSPDVYDPVCSGEGDLVQRALFDWTPGWPGSHRIAPYAITVLNQTCAPSGTCTDWQEKRNELADGMATGTLETQWRGWWPNEDLMLDLKGRGCSAECRVSGLGDSSRPAVKKFSCSQYCKLGDAPLLFSGVLGGDCIKLTAASVRQLQGGGLERLKAILYVRVL